MIVEPPVRQKRSSLFTSVVTRLTALPSSAGFAYATILALQLKVMWGLWLYKDLESGDTASYLLNARLWHTLGVPVFTWSPLYGMFYGSMFNLSTDQYAATIAHRLIMSLVICVLFLAVLRKLLDPLVAWLVAAWWVILPINFDALYGVHLFAVIPLLLAYLTVPYLPGAWGRGCCVAILLIAAMLMRNEITIPCVLFAVACLVYEIRIWRRTRKPVWRLAGQYGMPCLLAAGLCLAVYAKAYDRGQVRAGVRSKHVVNICQTYAFGYLQRHPEWRKNPWTDCPELMQQTFGIREPTLTDAALRNPGAMLKHFAWNFSLAPSGIQVLLFNAMAGSINPDYVAVHIARTPVLIASFLLAAIWIAGFLQLRRRWQYWWENWIRPQAWTWAVMLLVAVPVSIFVIATQRPRPSYMFSLSLLLMAFTGLSVQAILGPGFLSRWRALTAVVIALVLIATPRYFYAAEHQSPRTLRSYYESLKPFAPLLGPRKALVTYGYGGEVCYAFAAPLKPPCVWLDYANLRPKKAGVMLNDVLVENKVDFLYAGADMLQDPPVIDFVATAQANGWKLIGSEQAPHERWMLFERSSPK